MKKYLPLGCRNRKNQYRLHDSEQQTNLKICPWELLLEFTESVGKQPALCLVHRMERRWRCVDKRQKFLSVRGRHERATRVCFNFFVFARCITALLYFHLFPSVAPMAELLKTLVGSNVDIFQWSSYHVLFTTQPYPRNSLASIANPNSLPNLPSLV